MELKIVCKILIDHNTKESFEAIALARQYMLELGKKELEDPDINSPIRGCHVLAPVSFHFLQRSYTFLTYKFSVLMTKHALYFIRGALPSFVFSPNVFNVLHLSVLPNVLVSDMKT